MIEKKVLTCIAFKTANWKSSSLILGGASFKAEDGLRLVYYSFELAERTRLGNDFAVYGESRKPDGGSYRCESLKTDNILVVSNNRWQPTELVLKFEEISSIM
jgi:hypothetical protein